MAVSLNTALGAFPITALAGTAYVPLAGGTMTGALTLPAGTVGAPSLMFTGAGATTGLYSTGSNNISFAVNGVQNLYINTTTVWASGSGGFGILDSNGPLAFGVASDVLLRRDAAATLALRNSTTAQRMHIYGTYTDSSNYERLTLSTTAGTSVNITAETLGTGADNLDIVLTPAGFGRVYMPNGALLGSSNSTYSSLNVFAIGLRVVASGEVAWTSGAVNVASDTALMRNAAGVVEVNNGTAGSYRDLKLRNLLNTEYHQMTEMAAPSAPATNSVRIYAEDNGSGKTRLMALFATGAAVQLGIEP